MDQKTNLELIRTFGYNCRSHPNNIKYLTVIYDLKSKIQFFYNINYQLQFILIHLFIVGH
jgi:hypothetical protein